MIYIPQGIVPYDQLHMDQARGDRFALFDGNPHATGPQSQPHRHPSPLITTPTVAIVWSLGQDYHSVNARARTDRTVALFHQFRDEVFDKVAAMVQAEFLIKHI
jgi:hypothetical protein